MRLSSSPWVLAASVALVLASCASSKTPRAQVPSTAELGTLDAIVVGVGDLVCAPGQPAEAHLCRMVETAAIAQAQDPKAVLALGDLQYEKGSLRGFRDSYDLSWGKLKDRTRPALGNHEYGTTTAAGYFDYFGSGVGERGKGWYSFDIGSWHLIALNSNCELVGCGEGSEQLEWLKKDLQTHTAKCTLAYWHHPRFSSGFHGGDLTVAPLWSALDEAGADVVLAGHDHHYERFAPQDASGQKKAGGVRQFVVGTGGRSLYPMLGREMNHEAGNSSSFGVLRLALRTSGYEWKFISTPDSGYSDAGTAACK